MSSLFNCSVTLHEYHFLINSIAGQAIDWGHSAGREINETESDTRIEGILVFFIR